MPECQLCGENKLLTYRSRFLMLVSVCAECIREHFPSTIRQYDPRHRRR